MPLPGISGSGEMDFPNRVIDSQSTLPYKTGGTTQLAVASTPEDLVLVSALRRFENKDYVAEGTHTGGNNAATLTDSTADFLNWGVEVGDLITNTTDNNSSGTITAVTATAITVALTGGTDADFDTGDAYYVNKRVSHEDARATTIRKVRITTDLDVYVAFDGEASATRHDAHIQAGGAYNDDDVRIVSRISFIQVTGSEQPTLRWMAWGL